jgi:hypothetical protein
MQQVMHTLYTPRPCFFHRVLLPGPEAGQVVRLNAMSSDGPLQGCAFAEILTGRAGVPGTVLYDSFEGFGGLVRVTRR